MPATAGAVRGTIKRAITVINPGVKSKTMGFVDIALKTTVEGVLLVLIMSFVTYAVSLAVPAKPAIYFLVWAFVAVPLALIVTGWLATRAAHAAHLGPNKSTATAVGIALASAFLGIALWMLLESFLGVPVQVQLFSASLKTYGIAELITFVVTYALAGAIGGIFHYFTLQGA